MIASYNAKWEAIQIPVTTAEVIELPTDYWLPTLLANVANAIKIGEEYDMPELAMEAKTIETFATEISDNAQRSTVPNSTAPEYMLDAEELVYKCIAAPKK